MADGIRELPGSSSIHNGITVNTPYDNSNPNDVKVEDFLQLMIAQLSNQDFMNPVDDTQYVTQLAQFSSMQAMQELSYYSQTNYVTGLVGKTVTVAALGLGGAVSKDVGMVSSVNLSGDDYTVTVNGKEYQLSQIMNVAEPNTEVEQDDLEDAARIMPITSDRTPTSLRVRWDAPSVDAAALEGLRYDVYYTENGQIDLTNLSNVKQGEQAAAGINSNEVNITGLDPDKTYFISVVVSNPNGDYAIYQTATDTTTSAV